MLNIPNFSLTVYSIPKFRFFSLPSISISDDECEWKITENLMSAATGLYINWEQNAAFPARCRLHKVQQLPSGEGNTNFLHTWYKRTAPQLKLLHYYRHNRWPAGNQAANLKAYCWNHAWRFLVLEPIIPGVSRMTHSSDSFAVGLCVRNARVFCRGKLLPPRAWYAAHCKHLCAFLKVNIMFKGLTIAVDAQKSPSCS
jgi:hypothetical protein